MNNSDKISIIVPVYNRENRINRCLTSITNQTYNNLEIIVVDDASTDNTANVVQEYIKKDNRIKLISLQENGGVGKARNEGIKTFFRSESNYVSFVDSDDFIHPKFIETLYATAQQENADIVSCGRFKNILNDHNFSPLPDKYDVNIYSSEDGFLNAPKHLLCRIIRKNCFINKQNDEPLLCDEIRCEEDFSILYKLYINANKIVTVNVPLYYFCYDGTHITGGGFFDEFEIIKRAESMAKIVNAIDNISYPKIFNYYITFFISRFYMALTKRNLNTHKENFDTIFKVIKKYNLSNTILDDVKKNEKNLFLQPLKNDFTIIYKQKGKKFKAILFFIKHFISIKLYSFKFKNLFRKSLKTYKIQNKYFTN